MRVHEQRHMSSAGAPESAGLGFLFVFLWFSFKEKVQKEAPKSDFFLITRKRQREEGWGQSQPEELRAGQTTGRDSGEVPEKEPQSRLSRRNRERRGPEQVQSSPDGILLSP